MYDEWQKTLLKNLCRLENKLRDLQGDDDIRVEGQGFGKDLAKI